MNRKDLYEKVIETSVFEPPEMGVIGDINGGHTMGSKLVDYVSSKLSPEQKNAIKRCVREGIEIAVHGAYFKDIATVASRHQLNLPSDGVVWIERPHKNQDKQFNTDRPRFCFMGKERPEQLAVFVFPSPEYIFQCAEIIQAWMKYEGLEVENVRLTCFQYPDLENRLGEWTGLKDVLDEMGFAQNDVIIIGYVEQLFRVLARLEFERRFDADFVIDSHEGLYGYNILRSRNTKKRCVLLGVKYCFWGSASARIAETLASKGAKDVMYLAKAGARIVRDPQDLSESRLTGGIYAITPPYYIWQYKDSAHDTGVVRGPYQIDSGIDSYLIPSAEIKKTAGHISVPTVVGETRAQESDYHNPNPTTIDNEISFIDEALARLNNGKNEEGKCRFSCIHYITDFVTSTVSHDLMDAPGLDVDERKNKESKLDSAYEVVAAFVAENGFYDDSEYFPPRTMIRMSNREPAIGFHYSSRMMPSDAYAYLRNDRGRRSTALDLFPSLRSPGMGARLSFGREAISRVYDELRRKDRPTVAVYGDAGVGKSILMSAIFYDLFENRDEIGGGLAPIYIDLSAWEKEVVMGTATYNDLVNRIFEIEGNAEKLRQQYKVVLFVDGYDQYCEFKKKLFGDLGSLFGKYGRLVAWRTYPFEKWARNSTKIARLPSDLKVSVWKIYGSRPRDRRGGWLRWLGQSSDLRISGLHASLTNTEKYLEQVQLIYDCCLSCQKCRL